MATLDEIVVRIKADVSQLERELKRVSGITQQETKKMGGALGGLAGQFKSLVPALSVAAIVQFGRAAFTAADHINDLAQRIGFTGSTLSALNIPLLQAGSSLDEFAASAAILNNQVGEAAKGNQEAVKAFDQLGLSVQSLLALNEEERFYAVADALSQVGDQATRTEAGRNLLGRGFATMNPILNQTNGNMREFVEQAKTAGDALTDDQLKRIDEFGDKWVQSVERIKLAMANAMPGLQLYLDGILGIVNLPTNAFKAGEEIGYAIRGLPKNVSLTEPKNLNDSEAALIFAAAMAKGRGAKGSNSGLIKPSGGAKGAAPLPADYDSGAFQKYLADLNAETDALGKSDRELAVRKALTEAQQAAQKDYADGLRDTSLLYEDEAQQIEKLAGGFYDLQRQIEDNRETTREWTKQLADGLTDIALNFDSASSAAEGFFRQLATQILNKHVTGPLSESIMGLIGGGLGGLGGTTLYEGFGAGAASRTVGGIGSLLGFADGGRPPVGVPSIVGERGPEIFVPDSAGTVVPNHAMGGGNNVTIVFNVSPGVQGTVEAEIRRAAPGIAQMAHNSVFQAIQRGGPERRIVRP